MKYYDYQTAIVPCLVLAPMATGACEGKTADMQQGTVGGNAAGGGVPVGGAALAGGTTATDGTQSVGGGDFAGAAAFGGAATGGGAAAGGTAAAGGRGQVDCSLVDCSYPNCPSNAIAVTMAGNCCPTCVAVQASCDTVACEFSSCPAGFIQSREPGACCDTCYPTASAKYPDCSSVKCAKISSCPLGYAIASPSWSCCEECTPDPNYCETDSDCVLAVKSTGACCGSCSSAISVRLYDQDPCYSAVYTPRTVPASCLTDTCLGAVLCGACPDANGVVCSDRHCKAISWPII